MKNTKPKVAIVPRYESPEKKRLRFEVRRMEWGVSRGYPDRRDRERAQAQLDDARARLAQCR